MKTPRKNPEDTVTTDADDKSPGIVIQQDWDQREWIANVTADILRITAFLNKFETTVRGNFANLNDKLVQLERQMDFLEARYLTMENIHENGEE